MLVDRAVELRQSLGFVEPVADRAWGFNHDDAYLRWASGQGSGNTRWAEPPAGRPAVLRVWYRTSPRALLPVFKGSAVNPSDPPMQLHGMTSTIVASAIMFTVNTLLLRMPLTRRGDALDATGAWVTAAAIVILAVAGFRLATGADVTSTRARSAR